MSYKVKEIFYSIQGEGHNLGHPAIFCRFSGCNMWDGREESRKDAKCKICDTDFIGGEKFTCAKDLANSINQAWLGKENKMVIFTGGEPALQLDHHIIEEVKKHGFKTAIETNGSIKLDIDLDWITVSPKTTDNLIQVSGDELKLLYPLGIDPKSLEKLDFQHFYLSPITSPNKEVSKRNLDQTINYVLENTHWKLTGQFHKFWNIR